MDKEWVYFMALDWRNILLRCPQVIVYSSNRKKGSSIVPNLDKEMFFENKNDRYKFTLLCDSAHSSVSKPFILKSKKNSLSKFEDRNSTDKKNMIVS